MPTCRGWACGSVPRTSAGTASPSDDPMWSIFFLPLDYEMIAFKRCPGGKTGEIGAGAGDSE